MASWEGESEGDWLGQEMLAAGDLDGDGLEELAVSAMAWPAGDRHGRVYGLSLDTPDLGAAELVIDQACGQGLLGRAMVSGDFDGDSQIDLALGAPEHDEGRGQVTLFFGPLAGHLTTLQADRAWEGEHEHDTFGAELASANLDLSLGDLDLLVSAPYAEEGGIEGVGRVYLLQGPL